MSPRPSRRSTSSARRSTIPEVWRGSGDLYRIDRISPELIFQAMVQYKASDVHLSPGVNPVFRIDNDMKNSELIGPLVGGSDQHTHQGYRRTGILGRVRENQADQLQLPPVRHWLCARVGIYQVWLAALHAALPARKSPTFETLHIPRETMTKLAELHRGLLLVTGMTGSGKTTTCAALIDYINAHRNAHILTIENPVEYVHLNKKSVVSQRSLGMDVEQRSSWPSPAPSGTTPMYSSSARCATPTRSARPSTPPPPATS
jgi:twitching motility protein PilT